MLVCSHRVRESRKTSTFQVLHRAGKRATLNSADPGKQEKVIRSDEDHPLSEGILTPGEGLHLSWKEHGPWNEEILIPAL